MRMYVDQLVITTYRYGTYSKAALAVVCVFGFVVSVWFALSDILGMALHGFEMTLRWLELAWNGLAVPGIDSSWLILVHPGSALFALFAFLPRIKLSRVSISEVRSSSRLMPDLRFASTTAWTDRMA